MPARILGMIGVVPPAGGPVHVIGGGISRDWIAQHSREHEEAGFDEVLVGYYSSSADGLGVALWGAAHTQKLSYLVAHRPGRVLPALMARKFATLDVLTQGRISIHVIIGGSDQDMQAEGDFTSKEERYLRGAEYVDVMRRLWAADAPIDYNGDFYKLRQAFCEVKPVQQPHPTLLFGGSSAGALDMGAKHCDVFAMFGEPLAATAARVADYRARCAGFGREARFNMSFRPVIAETEGQAWDKAKAILAQVKSSGDAVSRAPISHSAERLMEFAKQGDVHDERLWMPIAEATSAHGNTTCLVGTAAQVADALLKYYELGVHSFLLRGFDPLADVPEFGRELLPRVRAGALAIDRKPKP
ncbi:LLM class flavin-dependent oxidoreductase [Variovorax sp. KK3]|uniref:LLM class flavin-dependent oxidoreductase n=1 Tax=Variovorax sp. KK3 TaxID=1855728 RepID=UPI00097C1F71|nr:LLM class flavin-dependent oxidoreductase [Variovorax sp. KK3]